jgi:hypothetical protein
MQSGSLTIPGTNVSYGGGNLWNANTAGNDGIMMFR